MDYSNRRLTLENYRLDYLPIYFISQRLVYYVYLPTKSRRAFGGFFIKHIRWLIYLYVN